VFSGPSWFDGRIASSSTISKTSFVAKMCGMKSAGPPGLYLGKVFMWEKPSIHFSAQLSV